MMQLLGPYKLLAACAVLAGLLSLSALGGWTARGWRAAAELQRVVAEHLRQLTAIEQEARAESERQRAEAARRSLALQEIQDASFLRAQSRAAAVRRAGAVGDGLRLDVEAAAAAQREAGGDPAVAGVCPAAERTLVFAKLLPSVELRGREMARIADEARDALAECNAAYDALTQGEPR